MRYKKITRRKKHEETLQQAVVKYITLQYPDVIVRSDLSGMKLTIGQAVKIKKLQSSRAFPDLFIAEPRKGYHGLFLELKKSFDEVYKKNGQLRNIPHIQEQAEMLHRLSCKGYCAMFSTGFDDAVKIIDEYLR